MRILIWTERNCLDPLYCLEDEGWWDFADMIKSCFSVILSSCLCPCISSLLWCFVYFLSSEGWISFKYYTQKAAVQNELSCEIHQPLLGSFCYLWEWYREHIYFSNWKLYTWLQIFICLQFSGSVFEISLAGVALGRGCCLEVCALHKKELNRFVSSLTNSSLSTGPLRSRDFT